MRQALLGLLLALVACGTPPASQQARPTTVAAVPPSLLTPAPSMGVVATLTPVPTTTHAPTQLPTPTRVRTTPTPEGLVTGGQIVFVREQNIWLFDIHTQQETQLTEDKHSSSPVWTPDGELVVFVSDRDGRSDIMQMQRDGTGSTSLTRSDGTKQFPTYDSDGKLYFVRRALGDAPTIEVVRLERDGNEQVIHTEPGGLCGPTGLSALDEDRITLALNCGRGSYVLIISALYKTSRDLINNYSLSGYCASASTWGHDTGFGLVVGRLACNSETSELWWVELNQPAHFVTTIFEGSHIGNVSWSPMGNAIVFEQWAANQEYAGLWVYEMADIPPNPRQIVENGGSPAWRPELSCQNRVQHPFCAVE